MKIKELLILWILVVPLVMYLGFATVIVWPIFLYEAEIRDQTVSSISLLHQAWAWAWMFFFTRLGVWLVILAIVWLLGLFTLRKLYRRDVKEKAESRQKV